MWVCSGNQIDSNPRCSISLASSSGLIAYSVANIAIPNCICTPRKSVVVGHAPGFDSPEEARRVLLAGPEFLLRLAVDERRPALFGRDLVTAFERRAEVSRLCHVLSMRAQAFGDLVITYVLLEQVEAQRHG